MKIPDTVSEIMEGEVVFTWHAGQRFCEWSGIRDRDGAQRVATAVLADGVFFGGQRGGDLAVLSETKEGQELVFILYRKWDVWLVRTVLTKSQAIANMQMLAATT